MWPLAIGALIGSGISAISAARQSRHEAETARYNVDATNKAQREMAHLAFEQNRQMWLEANQYNSPAAQMARLKMAGLNPNLVYGPGAVGNSAGSIPQFQAPRQSYDYKTPLTSGAALSGGIQNFLNTMTQAAQLDNVKAQTSAIQTRTVNEALEGQILRNTQWHREQLIRDKQWLLRLDRDVGRDPEIGTRALRRSQLSALQSNVQRGQAVVDSILQDIERKKIENKWLDVGITPRDNPYARFGFRALDAAGISLTDFIRKYSPFNK